MEDHGSPSLLSPEENQEEADIRVRFLAMGQAKGLEWAKKMVAAQGVQQRSETSPITNTDKVQPSDSGLCLLTEESIIEPAKRKRPARAAAGSKLKRTKKDMADSDLPKGPSTSQKDIGAKRAKKDSEEQEAVGANGVPLTEGWGFDPNDEQTNTPIAQEQTSQPARSVACSITPGALGQELQVELGKMMDAMHSFMASAKALVGLGMDKQGASNRRACAGQVWGQDTNSLPKVQDEASSPGTEVSDRVAIDTVAGGSDKRTLVRPDVPLLKGRSSLVWRVPLETRERIWNREFIYIFSLLTFAKEGAYITVPSKEVEKHKWKRKVKPEESADNWLEAFAVHSDHGEIP
ncbi:hypothetical protein NDU88_003929 [Pleurodeles waltl]|uniref:Uncharacterized protein n=1 Tax=Pleurodeles waltl TaxID=8319 RepID=A0AAV7TQ24_PLEWA|nr:hypothetical protein NDU88_003929 [Pleurodeles waltl]